MRRALIAALLICAACNRHPAETDTGATDTVHNTPTSSAPTTTSGTTATETGGGPPVTTTTGTTRPATGTH
jgi:hypothetical protein